MIYNGTSQESRELTNLVNRDLQLNDIDLRDTLVQVFNTLKEGDAQGYRYWYNILFSEISILADLKYFDIEEYQKININAYHNFTQFRRKEKREKYLKKNIDTFTVLLSYFSKWLTGFITKGFFESELYLTICRLLNTPSVLSDLSFIYYQKNSERQFIKHKTPEFIVNIFILLDYKYENNERNFQEDEEIDFLAEACHRLNTVFIDLFFMIKGKSDQYYSFYIENSSQQPHIDLMMTYQHLYKYPQKMLNSFAKRYLNLYFNDVLEEKRHLEKKDFAYLTFGLNDGIQYAKIHAGTKFIAGTDSLRKNVYYSLDHNVVLTSSEVKKITVKNIEFKEIGTKYPINIVSAVKSFEQPLLEGELINLPLFGSDGLEKQPINFYVSDHVLLLDNGDREVVFTFHLDAKSMNRLAHLISNVKEATGWKGDLLFNNIFGDIFTAEFTGPEGWVTVKKITFLTTKYTPTSLAFKVIIKADEDSVVGANKVLHAINSFTDKPVFKFTLNTETYLFGYSFLSELIIDRIVIDVNVLGYSGFNVYNHDGELATNVPYAAWGNQPVKGNYIVLGSNEVFYKNLNYLDIDCHWYNLPFHPNGLTGYYETYEQEELKNSKFKLKLERLKNGKWIYLDTFSMFKNQRSTSNEEVYDIGALSDLTYFHDIEYVNAPSIDEVNQDDLQSFSNYSKNGYLKFTLENPEVGFGHEVYPKLLMSQVGQKSFFTFWKKNKVKEYSVPFVPFVSKITANYSAKSTIILDEKIKNVDRVAKFGFNYGTNKVVETVTKQHLFPKIEMGISIEIEIANAFKGDIISLLFQLKNNSNEEEKRKANNLIWEFYNGGEWESIAESNILRNETDNLTKTGMVIFKVPETFNDNSTSKSICIRIHLAGEQQNDIVIEKIYSKVVEVVLNLPEETSHYDYGKVLSPNSISRSLSKIPGIRSIEQPLPSFGGKSLERENAFVNRISETIKHRNRPVTTWDYEKIILTEFHEISQVICIPVSEFNNSLLIVIIPVSEEKFPITTNDLLKRVDRFLKSITSSHVKFEICSPLYEKIKVNVSLSLKVGYTQGFYLEEINTKLTNFINTISSSNSNRFVLGGKLHLSDVLSYLKTIPYIDGIKHLSLVHLIKDDNNKFKLIDTAQEDYNESFILASKPWSVLTSSTDHEVYLDDQKNDKAGINNLKISTDLIVNSYN
ncbi:baseplate J/gp47 family protein [Flammeovirga kamogawensis]|uniref:Baseplate J/gp47 family protein n=1 Tax=Flammeovirga kamogawensis TaxID=373891 RepID=A0ABX8GXY2_9BACT|nr:baseplate J/gp47 family protein [Flammeovirga kamogawensis]MBB6458864.1 hypothetical protein [Flammeovirga kamogawensis]QWG08445.1 baseplate J/gp47 family protein [Flammeovirga kamogawensis]TRX66742.1 hypothetical protein EO216_00840 [Flammeovirga kamogawensis]